MFRVICVLLVAVQAAALSAAEKYTSKDGKYTATFPAAPKESPPKEIDAPGLGVKIKQFTTALDVKKDLAFMVVYHDYPEVVAMAAPQRILGLVRDGCQGAAGRLVADKELADAKPPAREFQIEKEGTYYRSRAILSGTRLYQVIVVGRNRDDVNSKEANEFIESFAIAN